MSADLSLLAGLLDRSRVVNPAAIVIAGLFTGAAGVFAGATTRRSPPAVTTTSLFSVRRAILIPGLPQKANKGLYPISASSTDPDPG
jgi:hypothetical protein